MSAHAIERSFLLCKTRRPTLILITLNVKASPFFL